MYLGAFYLIKSNLPKPWSHDVINMITSKKHLVDMISQASKLSEPDCTTSREKSEFTNSMEGGSELWSTKIYWKVGIGV